MKAHLANLPMKVWLLAAIPAILLGYPIARLIVSAVIRTIVPDVVRSVLDVI